MAGSILPVVCSIGRPQGRLETKKRQPPIPLPPELLGHLRRWKRRGQRFCVEWYGKPVRAIRKGFAAAARDAGLGPARHRTRSGTRPRRV